MINTIHTENRFSLVSYDDEKRELKELRALPFYTDCLFIVDEPMFYEGAELKVGDIVLICRDWNDELKKLVTTSIVIQDEKTLEKIMKISGKIKERLEENKQ